MALQAAPYRTRHRVTFSYPLKDALEVRWEGGGGDGFMTSLGFDSVPDTSNGTQSASNSRGVNESEPFQAFDGVTFTGVPLLPSYSGGYIDGRNGVTVQVFTGKYSGNVQSVRVYLVGPSAQEIDLLNETGIGPLFSNGVVEAGRPAEWQELNLGGTTFLFRPFSDLSIVPDEDGVGWNLFMDVETIFANSPNNQFEPYIDEFLYLEASAEIPIQYVRYVDKEVPDMDDDSNVYVATPSLEIKFGPRNGTLSEQPTEINLPKDSFTAAISKGEPFAPISVLIERVVFDGTGTVLFLQPVFRGEALTATRNPNGKANRVVVKCVNIKALLKVPMGIPATAECAFTFTGVGCRVDPFDRDKVRDGVVQSVDGQLATILLNDGGSAYAGAENERLYHRGFLILNGVRIGIREWHVDNFDLFYCSQRVPASWDGETVLAIPGCDKTYETCDARWDNKARFGGYGRVIPLYNPILETR